MTDFFAPSGAGTDWATPRWVWRPLGAALDGFDLDPASGAEPEPLADVRFTPRENGLARDWFGDVFLNPPYGRQANEDWAHKTAREFDAGRVETVTVLVPASTSTDWFGRYAERASLLATFDSRLDFGGDDSPSFDSALLALGDVGAEYRRALDSLGRGRGVTTRLWEPAAGAAGGDRR